ncbi:hypothetical protein ACOME3_001634 [Neoechinorhynchus agilis]
MIALLCFTAFISIGFSSGNQKRQGQESPLRDQFKEQNRIYDPYGRITVTYYAESDTETDSNITEIQQIIDAFNKENGKRVYLKKIKDESKAGRVEIYAKGRHFNKKYELERYEKSKFEEFFNYSIDVLVICRHIDVEYYMDPDLKADKNYTDIKKIVASSKYKQNVHVEKRDNKSKAGKVHMKSYGPFVKVEWEFCDSTDLLNVSDLYFMTEKEERKTVTISSSDVSSNWRKLRPKIKCIRTHSKPSCGGNRKYKYVALDCEMVGVGGNDSALARVSIVNEHDDVLLDKYVIPREKITDYRFEFSGITKDLIKVHGKPFTEVQKEAATLMEGKILIGHGLNHDLGVLLLSHPRRRIRDTSKYKPFRTVRSGGGTPSLKLLARTLLGVEIHEGCHDSV